MVTDSAPRLRPVGSVRPCPATALMLLATLACAPCGAYAFDVEFEKIARTGDPVPGREGLSVFNGRAIQPGGAGGPYAGVLGRPCINDSGEVVFRGVGSHPSNFNVNPVTGIYAWEPNQPLIRLVDNTTDANIPSVPVPGKPAGSRFTDFSLPLLNNAGDVVFFANFTVPGQGSQSGIFATTTAGGPITLLVDSTTAVPGYPGVTFALGFAYDSTAPRFKNVLLNNAGRVVFFGRFQSGSLQLEGLFSTTVGAGPIIRIADKNNFPTTDANWTVFDLDDTYMPALNDGGTVIFAGLGRRPNGTTRYALFTVPADGSAPPAVQAAQFFTSFTATNSTTKTVQSFFTGHDINNAGQFTFVNKHGAGTYDYALVVGSTAGGPFHAALDNTGGVAVPGRSGSTFELISTARLNDLGDIAPQAWYTPSRRGVFSRNVNGLPASPLGVIAYGESSVPPPGRTSPAYFTGFNEASAPLNELGNAVLAPNGYDGVSDAVFGLYFYEQCSATLFRVFDDDTAGAPLPTGLAGTYAPPGCAGSPCDRGVYIHDGFDARHGLFRSINNSNTIAFATAFSTFDVGVYVARVRQGGPVQIDVCPPDLTLECPADISPASTGQAVASGCGTVTVTYADNVTLGCGSTSTIVRTWTATNGASTATCTQTITLVDNTPPVLVCPSDQTVACDADLPAAYAAWLASAAATDACGTPTLVDNAPPAPTACGETTVTWTATDACGNGTACSATFTVIDTTAPAIHDAEDLTVACNPATNADEYAAWLAAVTASDACGVQSLTNDAPLSPTPCGATTVSWTATDRCGLTTTVSATFTIVDVDPPTWTTAPIDLVVECDGAGNSAQIDAWLASAAAADACGTPTVAHDYTGLDPICGLTGSKFVTWTATDACGNAATTSAVVTVVDTTAPTFTFVPADLTLECGDAGNDAAIAAWLASATAADTCGDVNVAHDYAGLTATGCGSSGGATVTWVATDACGNTATATATLTIQDTTAPTIAAPADVVVGVDAGACYATNVALGTPTAGDNCGSVTVVNDAPTQFAIGTTTVTWTATDACGHVSYASQTVTVENLAPIAEIAFQQLTDIGAEARVRLDASGSSDAEHDNADLTFTWIIDGITVRSGVGPSYEVFTTYLAFGAHDVLLRVIDPCGAQNEAFVTLVLDPAELSLIEVKRAVVNFCGCTPRISITGQIGLPLGVDFSEMAPQIYTRVALAGIDAVPVTLVLFATYGPEDQHWRYVNPSPHALGIRRFTVNWSGNSYQYRDAGFPIELRSDLISTTETILEVRNRNRRLIPGPFTLNIDGQASITLDPNFTVLASSGLTYDVQVAGKRIELTLPFPLVATTPFTFSGGLVRQFEAGANLRASIGKYKLDVTFDEDLFPLRAATTPRTLELDLGVGTQPYPGTTLLGPGVLDVGWCHWRTWECDEEDDD